MVQPVFNILSSDHTDGAIKVVLTTRPDSAIFEGHFPGQPIVPGACIMQTVKEILATTLKSRVHLNKADNIKFLNMVTPDNDTLLLTINYQFTESEIKVNAELATESVTFMKLQGTFTTTI